MIINEFSFLRLLSDGETHSTQSISKYFQCTSFEIFNVLRDVSELGINLIEFNNKGYWLKDSINWLNSESVLKNINQYPNVYPFDLIITDSVDSTNNFLINRLEKIEEQENYKRILVIASELQTNGRGRLGRSWVSGLGESLTFSMGWYFNSDISKLSGLSLVIGIAIIRVFNSLSIHNVNLKWPNDIIFNYKKLGGILIEFRQSKPNRLPFIVIGIGINFNLSRNSRSLIKQDATDLFAITNKNIDRNLMLSALLSELQNVLIKFEKYGLNYFMEEWINYHAFQGKKVSLYLPDNSVIEGTVDGVGHDGSLILITKAGRSFYNIGDISLRLK